MNLLKEILNMKGPLFLLFYAGVAVVGFVLYRYVSSSLDSSSKMPRLKIPLDLDPYLVAYIKGGVKNIIPSAIGVLLFKNVLELEGEVVFKSKSVQETDSELENKILTSVNPLGSKRRDLMSKNTAVSIELFCVKYKKYCEDEFLVRSGLSLVCLFLLKVLIILALLGLGIGKCSHGLNTGHSNIGFLIIEIFVMLIFIGSFCKTTKLTERGRKFIIDISTTNENLKEKSSNITPEMCALGITLYGTSFLTISTIAGLSEVFNFKSSSGSFFGSGASCSGCSACSSCSSSDSSSCSSCGGCGGD